MPVLDPFKTMSGALPTGSEFLDLNGGVFSAYPNAIPYNTSPGTGWKIDQAEPPSGSFTAYWEKYSANALGQGLRDVVNSGTVVLSASLSGTSASLAQTSATLVSVSSSLSSTVVLVSALSASVSATAYSGTVLAATVTAVSASLSGVSASVGPWSGSLPIGLTFNNFSATVGPVAPQYYDFVPRVMGPTGSDLSPTWGGKGGTIVTGTGGHVVSGSMSATLDRLFVDYYTSAAPSTAIVSGALVQVVGRFMGLSDLAAVSASGGAAVINGTTTVISSSVVQLGVQGTTASLSVRNASASYYVSATADAAAGPSVTLSASGGSMMLMQLDTGRSEIHSLGPSGVLCLSGNWVEATGAVVVSGSVRVTGAYAASGAHSFGNGLVSVSSSGQDSFHAAIPAASGATFFEGWINDVMKFAVYGPNGDVWAPSGTLTINNILVPGGINMTGSKLTNLGAGSVAGDSVEWTQLTSVSSALSTTISASITPVSSSVSGILNSGSATPTALYIKSPGGGIYQLTIDNSGVLSSTLV